MDFSIPEELAQEVSRFKDFLKEHVVPNLSTWYREGSVPRALYLRASHPQVSP
jgi:hypothetical protein